jgi:hypothetical protein
MTTKLLFPMKNHKLMDFIAYSIVQKILASFDGRMEYRRLRWIVCSRTCLTKKEANRILLILKKEGLIGTTKPQANSERIAWLTPKGQNFLWQHDASSAKRKK